MPKPAGKQFWKSALVTVAIGLAVVTTITYFNRQGRLESIELSRILMMVRVRFHYQQASAPMDCRRTTPAITRKKSLCVRCAADSADSRFE